MRKKNSTSTLHCALVHLWLPLFLVVSFSYAFSVAAEGNEVNNVNGDADLTKAGSLENHDEEEKFKFLPPKPIFKKSFFKKPLPIVKPLIPPKPIFKKPFFKKPIPIVKPLFPPKPILKPIPIVKKPIPKPFPVEKPLPIPLEKKPFLKPFPKPFVPKPIPFVKKPFPKPFIPKPIPFVKKPFPKPLPKPIPFVKKPFPKPFPIPKKPFFPPVDPAVETEEFLKPKPFFKKPIPKLPFPPKIEKPLLPPLPIHKPIPTP